MNNAIDTFIKKLEAKENVLGIILFGSWARENNRPDSDVDLLVILSDGFKRTVEYSGGQAFEITYTTEKGAIDYWQKNLDDCFDIWNSGKVICDKVGNIERLKLSAQQLTAQGKPYIDQNEKDHLKFDAEDQLKSIQSLSTIDPATANMVLFNKIFNLTETFFNLKQLWTPAPKQRLAEINKLNPELGLLIRKIYMDNLGWSDKFAVFGKIIDKIFV